MVDVYQHAQSIRYRARESDAKTHRTPKALCAKSTRDADLFREALGVRTRPRAAFGTITCDTSSQISSQTREHDILDQRVRRARQGERDRISHLRRAHHFLTRPFALDAVPDIGGRRRRVNIDDPNFAVAQFFSNGLRESFKREFAHAICAPVGKSSFGCNGENVHDARSRRHSRSKALRLEKRGSDIDPDGLLPFDWGDLCERFHHCDAGIIHEQMDWLVADFGNQVRHASRVRQIMN